MADVAVTGMADHAFTIVLPTHLQHHAQRLTRLSKVPASTKDAIKRLAQGLPVRRDAARDALFYAACAACTAGSASPSRREDREAAMAIWVHLYGPALKDAEPTGFGIDFNDPQEVTAWLDQ